MLSRVADSIYWMSRYVERAENIARFIDVQLHLSLDMGPDGIGLWDPLISTTGDHDEFYKQFGTATQRNVIEFLTFDQQNPNSIISCLRFARENARTVRDSLSSHMWEELNKIYLFVRGADRATVLQSPFEFFTELRLCGYTLDGATQNTMSRGEAWHFHRLGELLERADKTSRILDVKYFLLLPQSVDVETQLDTNQWASLLKSASALEMYRKVHGRITPRQVAEFLILDPDFPRAMHFCLMRAEESLLAIIAGGTGANRNKAEQRLGRLRAELDYGNIDEIIAQGLHEFIDRFQGAINEVGDAIYEAFFAAQPLPEGVRRPG